MIFKEYNFLKPKNTSQLVFEIKIPDVTRTQLPLNQVCNPWVLSSVHFSYTECQLIDFFCILVMLLSGMVLNRQRSDNTYLLLKLYLSTGYLTAEVLQQYDSAFWL